MGRGSYRGDALLRRTRGDRSQNVEDAIGAYAAALDVTAKIRLARAYAARIAGDPAQNLTVASGHASDALDVFTQDAYPLEWARASRALAELTLRSSGPPDPARDEDALERYRGGYEAFVSAGLSTEILRAARGYADALADRGWSSDSTIPYRHAFNAAEDLYRSSLSRVGKEAELGVWCGYRSMLSDGRAYGAMFVAAFDVDRHSLYEALRWPLPANAKVEKDAGERLTDYLRRGDDDPRISFTTKP